MIDRPFTNDGKGFNFAIFNARSAKSALLIDFGNTIDHGYGAKGTIRFADAAADAFVFVDPEHGRVVYSIRG